MIEISNLQKAFGSKKVFTGLNLSLEKEKIHILLGRSGCGKSTLLRMIAGLDKDYEGELSIQGHAQVPTHAALNPTEVGYMVQGAGLFPHMNCERNVDLASILLKKTSKEIATRRTFLMEMMGLDRDVMKKYPSQISGGQKQRVALVRALMLDPPLLLLDEPMGALDPILRHQLQKQLREVFKSLSKTVVLVTHDVVEASFLGDHIVLLNKGKIEQQGSFSHLLDSPQSPYVTEFIGAQQIHRGHHENV